MRIQTKKQNKKKNAYENNIRMVTSHISTCNRENNPYADKQNALADENNRHMHTKKNNTYADEKKHKRTDEKKTNNHHTDKKPRIQTKKTK